MDLFPRNAIASFVLALLLFTGSNIVATPRQNPASPAQGSGSAKPTRHDSVEVRAQLSPEEVEDGKLNDAYQAIAEQRGKGVCGEELIERYKAEVIAPAEKSTFRVPKNKFLFLANRDIGNCYLSQQKFVEAEASFERVMPYAAVWPGTDDSDYPINLRQMASAQMGQGRWDAAELSLQKSLAIFDVQIDRALKSDSESSRTARAGILRGSKAVSLAYLGIVYMREGRTAEALQTERSGIR